MPNGLVASSLYVAILGSPRGKLLWRDTEELIKKDFTRLVGTYQKEGRKVLLTDIHRQILEKRLHNPAMTSDHTIHEGHLIVSSVSG